jgi:hypothetical protein
MAALTDSRFRCVVGLGQGRQHNDQEIIGAVSLTGPTETEEGWQEVQRQQMLKQQVERDRH